MVVKCLMNMFWELYIIVLQNRQLLDHMHGNNIWFLLQGFTYCTVFHPWFGVSVKPGLWTGLNYGLDWPKQLYTDSEHHQGYNSLSPALPQVAVEAASGSSAIGNLMDAHPHMIVPHEYGLFEKWAADSKKYYHRKRYIFNELYEFSYNSAASGDRNLHQLQIQSYLLTNI